MYSNTNSLRSRWSDDTIFIDFLEVQNIDFEIPLSVISILFGGETIIKLETSIAKQRNPLFDCDYFICLTYVSFDSSPHDINANRIQLDVYFWERFGHTYTK